MVFLGEEIVFKWVVFGCLLVLFKIIKIWLMEVIVVWIELMI